MKILNENELYFVHAGISDAAYDYAYAKSIQCSLFLGIPTAIFGLLNSTSSTIPGIILTGCGLGIAVGAIAFAYAYTLIMSHLVTDDIAEFLEGFFY